MGEQSFPSQKRLKKPAEFGVVYNNNQTRVKGQYFTVLAFFRSNAVDNETSNDTIAENFSSARIGVVVSKKVAKQAVKRNRIKRVMRESFRLTAHPDEFDFVAIARPGSADIDGEILRKELNKLWKKLHQRCDAL